MRKEGWEQILNEHIKRASYRPFEWGHHDCALWSSRWVKHATGIDLHSEWEGRYSSESELQVLMAKRGITSYEQIADKAGLLPITVSFAQRGDIVLHPQDCLGICNGRMSHFLTASGMTIFPTLNCLKAWKVD